MRRPVLILTWLLTDILLFLGCYIAAYFLRVGFVFSTDFPFQNFLLATFAAMPGWMLVMLGTRTFSMTRSPLAARSIMYIVFSALVGVSFFALGYYFLWNRFFSRLLLLAAFGLSAGIVLLWHVCFQRIARQILRSGSPAFPTLIIGATREAAELLKTLRERRSPFMPVAILDARGTSEKEVEGVPVLGKLNKLEDTLERLRITHMIQCSDLEQTINLLSACRRRGLTYMLLPSVLGIVERDESIESLEGWPVTVVSPPGRFWEWLFR